MLINIQHSHFWRARWLMINETSDWHALYVSPPARHLLSHQDQKYHDTGVTRSAHMRGNFLPFHSTCTTLMTGSSSRNQTEDGQRLQSGGRGNAALTSRAPDPRVTPWIPTYINMSKEGNRHTRTHTHTYTHALMCRQTDSHRVQLWGGKKC